MAAFGRLCLASVIAASAVAESTTAELKELYAAHRWPELRDRLAVVEAAPLYRGAVAAAFRDMATAEKQLNEILRRRPRAEEARDAYDHLAHLYLDAGLYRRFRVTMEAKWATVTDRSMVEQERAAYAAFLPLPDQLVKRRRRFRLRDATDLWLPCTINGTAVTFFLDTGAGISAISESEAERLHLEFTGAQSGVGSSTGKHTQVRTAVARDLMVGDIHLRNVSFIVLPDGNEPWVHLAEGRRGLLGVPVLLTFGTLTRAKDGTLDVGSTSWNVHRQKSNLYFADDHLAVQVVIRGQHLSATLDTGAETTDLYAGLINSIPSLRTESIESGTTDVRGVAGAERFESITVRNLEIGLDAFEAVLRPAHILLQQVGPTCCVGNVGLDLLKQADSFQIDFRNMRLEMRGKRVSESDSKTRTPL